MRTLIFLVVGLPLASILLTSCGKYQSSIEAENACKEWAQQGGEYKVQGVHTEITLKKPPSRGIDIKQAKGIASNRPIRWCVEDAKTRKYLGIANQDAKIGNTIEVPCELDNLDCAVIAVMSGERDRVEKRFGY